MIYLGIFILYMCMGFTLDAFLSASDGGRCTNYATDIHMSHSAQHTIEYNWNL
jgi:hypothetical protein